jgi:hypothetical protein
MQRAQRPIVARPPQSLPFESSIRALGLGEPVDLGGGLAAIPVLAPERGWDPVDARLFTDSPPAGVEITEVNGGTVPVLHVRNGSDAPLFLVAGQLMRGGRQIWGLDADALVSAGTTIDLPATQVWSLDMAPCSATALLSVIGIEPSHVRSLKHGDVSDRRRRSAEGSMRQSLNVLTARPELSEHPSLQWIAADQDAVRQAIAGFSYAVRLRDTRRKLRESCAAVEAAIQGIWPQAVDGRSHHPMAALPPCNDRIGVLFFLDGTFLGGDLFASIPWSAAIEPALVRAVSVSRDFARARTEEFFRESEMFALLMGFQGGGRSRFAGSDRLLEIAQVIVGDVLHGPWSDGAEVGAERCMVLAHPYLQATATADGNGRLLHLQLNATRPSWLFALN